MRGTPCAGCRAGSRRGIIPAYAGNTLVLVLGLCGLRDHPRVCGEHGLVDCVANLPEGSSPRMRGTRDEMLETTNSPGIIPAYAGNT